VSVTSQGNDALTCSLRLLFDGKPAAEIAESIGAALGDNWFVVTQQIQEANHCYSCYWLTPDEFHEKLDCNDEVFVGDEAEINGATIEAWQTIPDGVYETMGYHLDDFIQGWRKKGLIVKANPDEGKQK
jgi:hypothetical protein